MQHFQMLSGEPHSAASDTKRLCDLQENDCLLRPHKCGHYIQHSSNPYKFALHRHGSTIEILKKIYLQTTNNNVTYIREISLHVLFHLFRIHRVVHFREYRKGFLCLRSLDKRLKGVNYTSMSPKAANQCVEASQGIAL